MDRKRAPQPAARSQNVSIHDPTSSWRASTVAGAASPTVAPSSIAADCAEAGATWFVAGSAIFNSDDPAAKFREIAAAAGC